MASAERDLGGRAPHNAQRSRGPEPAGLAESLLAELAELDIPSAGPLAAGEVLASAKGPSWCSAGW